MNRISLGEFQKNFDKVINAIEGGESIVITENGEPAMIALPYDEGCELLKFYNNKKATTGEESNNEPVQEYEAYRENVRLKASPDVAHLTDEEVNKLVHELRP